MHTLAALQSQDCSDVLSRPTSMCRRLGRPRHSSTPVVRALQLKTRLGASLVRSSSASRHSKTRCNTHPTLSLHTCSFFCFFFFFNAG